MYYHLRFTPYELPTDNLENFCDKYDRHIIASERFKRDGVTPTEQHYHVWIDSDLDLDSIRTAFKKAMSIPTGGRGRNNKYYSLEVYRNGEDVSYIIKQTVIVACKGFDRLELALRVPPDCKEDKKEKIQDPTAAPAAKKKESNFWNEITQRAILWEKSSKNKIETESALIIISKVYFTKGLPLPHPGDRKRWATSLVMYSKMKWEFIDSPEHEKILEEEALYFQAEHIVTNKPV